MAVYNYLSKDSEGKRKEGEIRADSIDTAVQKLSSNGQMVITLKEVDDTFDFLGPFLDELQLSIEKAKNRIPLSNIVFFTRQLATMFAAGLTLERAIHSLGSEEKHRKSSDFQQSNYSDNGGGKKQRDSTDGAGGFPGAELCDGRHGVTLLIRMSPLFRVVPLHQAAVHANIDRPKLRKSPITLGNSLEISTKHT